jgi:hypothetical protein
MKHTASADLRNTVCCYSLHPDALTFFLSFYRRAAGLGTALFLKAFMPECGWDAVGACGYGWDDGGHQGGAVLAVSGRK